MKQSYFFTLVILAGSAVGLALGVAFSGRDPLNNNETAAAPMALMADRTAPAQTSAAAAPAVPEPQAKAEAPAVPAPKIEQTAAAEPPAAPATPAAEPPAEQAAAAPVEPAATAETAAAAAEKPSEPADAAKIAETANAAKPAAGGERGILNGYKGFRHHRPGYKSNGDGWWYPRAAFAGNSKIQKFMETASAENVKPAPAAAKPAAEKAGPAALKTKAKAAAMSRAVALSRHEQWCAARHPSYDRRDNSYRETFTKEYCRSPYSQYL